MEVKEIQNKEVWESFLKEQKEKTFLQSWNWGEFQKLMGNSAQGGPAGGGKIWRLGIYDEGQLVSVVLVVKIIAKRGTFLLIQHLLELNKESFAVLLEELERIGEEQNAVFIRIAPLWNRNEENQKIFREFGFKEAQMHASAYELTWQLDIDFPEEEILKNMRKTTRYLIRQGESNSDIEIERSNNPSSVEIYQDLNKSVAKRQKFTPFSNSFIKNEFESFVKDDEVLLFFGKYKGEVAAASMIIFWSGIGFYHQAASLAKYSKFSIPYLLQWEAIKEAKKRGCVLYDFWGYVNPQTNPKHPWAGPTLFKMGFGGKALEYLKTQDLPISKKYWFIYLFEKIRKIKRRL